MGATGLIVILNGASSVGKTSVATAIQRFAIRGFMHLSMDIFLAMLPPRSFGTAEGLSFVPVGGDGLEVRSGPSVDRVLAAMRQMVADLAARGGNVLVDDVMLGEGDEADYRALLAPFNVKLIGLHASLAVIEARERQRGDRDIGLARWQIERVHRGRSYDLEIDTNTMSANDAARLICRAFDL